MFSLLVAPPELVAGFWIPADPPPRRPQVRGDDLWTRVNSGHPCAAAIQARDTNRNRILQRRKELLRSDVETAMRSNANA